MTGTTVKTAAQAAGVICPQQTGELGPDKTCNDCPHQKKCYAAVMAVLEG